MNHCHPLLPPPLLTSPLRLTFTQIQPTIIFIDEIDSILRGRNSSDHEATAMMKTQFMSLWDGLSTDTFSCRVIIMGKSMEERLWRRFRWMLVLYVMFVSQKFRFCFQFRCFGSQYSTRLLLRTSFKTPWILAALEGSPGTFSQHYLCFNHDQIHA